MATANDGFNALILEAERAAGLAALLPDLRKLKSMQVVLDDAKSKATKEERRAADLARANEQAANNLALAQKAHSAKQDEIAAAILAHNQEAEKIIAAAKAEATKIAETAKRESDGILKNATARAAGLITDAESAVIAKQREIDALEASIAKLNGEVTAQTSRLATVQRQREELRRSL